MGRIFIKGNEAIAESAVRGGCRFFAGYPITPQNEIPEYMSKRLPEVGGHFVQGESEIASINMVYGAAATGTRAMTSSSSPGISLKSEGISYLAGAELPAVIVNVTRGGPGLGSIQAAQMDYLQATKASGHGGFRMIVYAPATVQEAVDYTYKAFEKAEKYQSPVLICVDGCIGAMMEPVVMPEMKPDDRMNLKFFAAEHFNEKRLVVTSLVTPDEAQERFNIMKAKLYEDWKRTECLVEEYMLDDAELVIAAYGVSARISRTSIALLRARGIKAGMIRPITIYPFPYESFRKLDYSRVKNVLCAELSIPCQMIEDVKLGVMGKAPISSILHSGGVIFNADEIMDKAVALQERSDEHGKNI